jgi:hypothetical protein
MKGAKGMAGQQSPTDSSAAGDTNQGPTTMAGPPPSPRGTSTVTSAAARVKAASRAGAGAAAVVPRGMTMHVASPAPPPAAAAAGGLVRLAGPRVQLMRGLPSWVGVRQVVRSRQLPCGGVRLVRVIGL